MTLVIKFEAGLRPILKHQEHDQSSHGSWAEGSQGTTSNLSDDEIRDVIYNSKTVNEMFEKVANRLGKSMKPSVDNLSEDEITHYRGVSDVSRDAQRLLDGKIKFTEFQTWGQGIYLAEDKGIASNYGTLIGMKLDSSAKIVQGETTWDSAFDVSYENPSARTRNTTTSSFIDLGRIETQIRAEKMDNLSISDMRNIYWAGKGFDGFTTYGETVLFNGSKLTLNKADIGTAVQKHQNHDQKTHGSWANNNFNEETEGEDAQNTYFETYGIKTDGSKEPVGISRDEIRSLNDYTADGYAKINGYLRRFNREPDENDSIDAQQFRQMLENRVSDIDKLIEEAPEFFGDKNLYRVFDKSVLDTLEEGDVLTDKGFMSTTRVDITREEGLDTLQNLQIIRTTDNTPSIILPSESKKGKGLAVDYVKNAVSDLFENVSTAANEKEVLLPRNTSLKFRGYQKVNAGTDNVMDVAVFQRMDK